MKTELLSLINQIGYHSKYGNFSTTNHLSKNVTLSTFFKIFEFGHQEYFTSSTGVPCIGPAVQAGLLTYKQLYTLYAFSLNVTAS